MERGGAWLSDPAFTLGMSVFETIAVSPQGRLLDLELHLARLWSSARWLGVPPPAEEALVTRLKERRSEALEAAPQGEPLALRYTLSVSGRDHVSARVYPSSYVGSTLNVAPIICPPSLYLPRSVKHSSRAEWRAAARQLKVDEVLLCTHTGEVLEADQSGVCLLKGEELTLPPLKDGRRLESVGLRRLRRCAEELGLSLREGPISLCAEGALLLSSSLKGVAQALSARGEARPLSAAEHGAQEVAWRALRAQVRCEMGLSPEGEG